MFRAFLAGLPRNFARVFAPRYLVWHLAAIILTYLCVISGLDWWYFMHTRSGALFNLTLPAAILGFFVPLVAPVAWYYWGEWRGRKKIMHAAAALAQAEGLAYVVTALYKTFTGRISPDFLFQTHFSDTSRDFALGFLQRGNFFEYGLFRGWPSSHAAVAFAGAAVIIYLYPRNKFAITLVGLYALYIGLGVSVSIHWFSDFVAGAIFGTLIGVVVARGHTTTARLRAVV